MELLAFFDSNHVVSEKEWLDFGDISFSQIERWNRSFTIKNTHPTEMLVPTRLSSKAFSTILMGNRILIDLVESELDQIKACTWLSTLFVLTDAQGSSLSFYCADNLMDRLEEVNVGPGTSFAMQHAGINAISLAMELKKTAVLKGKEHTLELFSEWNCICQPIICGGEIVGFLDMSFSVEENYKLGIPLLKQIVSRIEEKYVELSPDMKQQVVYQRFDLYGLAAREKEVGYLWLQNKSVLCIAGCLGITEGTVRNVIKRIYKKTKVNDKGQYYRKFLIK
jgi:transcriptional regulator of acetoin/glycerol metabolism